MTLAEQGIVGHDLLDARCAARLKPIDCWIADDDVDSFALIDKSNFVGPSSSVLSTLQPERLMTGFIYIMSNASMGRRIKIGKSDRDPIYRRDELSNTSVPEPFVIEYTAFVDDHHGAERKIHASLRDHRPNKGREFFEIPIAEAIALIRQSCSVIREDIHYKSPEEIHQAEAARRRQELEKEKYDQLIREQNERVDTWVSKSNKNAEFRRQRHLEKRREKVLAIVGVGAMVA